MVVAGVERARKEAAVAQVLSSVHRLDWATLWRLLRPDSLLLAVAVAAAVAVAIVNVQIPALLGVVRV